MGQYSDENQLYVVGAWIVGVVAFFGLWAYAVATYGWFLGGGLGWIPSMFLAFIIALLWPLIALAAIGLFLYVYANKP